MRILHFIYDHRGNPWVGGGGAVRASEIYKMLQSRHQITVVCGRYPGSNDYVEGNLDYRFVGTDKNYAFSTFFYAFYCYQFLKKSHSDYDVVIEDFAPWNPIFSYRLKTYVPVILQVHHKEGYNILKKYKLFGAPFFLLERLYPRRFDHVISVSEKTKERFGLKAARIISNGIDAHLLEIDPRVGSYVAYIGRIDFYNKGLDIVLKMNLTCPLKLAGKGKDESKLRQEIKDKANIDFLGFLSDKNKTELMENAKFLIMPSRFEGQGIVALEAGALRKPLIVSDIPELSYVVENGFGISFKCGDTKDLEDKINFLWHNEKLIEEMGKNGREYAREWTWEKIASQYESYLMKIIGEQ
ncbi:MAG: glycosyltransferase family 4 protein [Dissulfurispiraceae bacterium]